MEDSREISRLVEDFLNRRYMLEMGKNKLAKYLKTSPEEIVTAKKIARKTIEYGAVNVANPKLPKILIIDIETAPLRAYVWSRWKQNIYLPQTLSEWFMLTWSAKWLFAPTVMSNRLTGEEVLREDDGRIVRELWSLLNEADILVAHNGDSFDVPKINSRLILNGLPPATPYQTIDTKKISAKQFGFSSNKLDALGAYFGYKLKLDTTFELWAECMKGNEQSLRYMEEYNRHDVELLEDVYLKLRPWTNAHPNVALYIESDVPVCTHCGSDDLKLESKYYTQSGKYDVYRCSCGALSRVRQSSIDKNVRKNLLISTGR